MRSENLIKEMLEKAEVAIDGTNPWDIQVNNAKLFDRVLAGGSLALGESYMDGWWSAEQLDETFCRIIRARLDEELGKTPRIAAQILLQSLKARLLNQQSVKRSTKVAKQHYDVGNDLYSKMLDPWMQYTCGYWEKGAQNLNEAQEAKLNLIAAKLKLEPGMRVLDVGCGWGGLSKYLAQKHKVQVTGITISEEQAKLARDWTKGESVTIELVDYRQMQTQQFDRIVSVGMFEHVGYKNYRTFMYHMSRLLKEDGIFLLHTIGADISRHRAEAWIDKYIFPGGMIPSLAQLSASAERLFVMEDWHNFGASYDLTLMSWHANFKAAWPELSSDGKYDERFYRMWEYYLLACAGMFRTRNTSLWQIVLTKHGLVGGYKSIR